MTDLAKIGPISIERAHLFDNSTFSFTNSATKTVASGSVISNSGQYLDDYSFEIMCTFAQALQLRGLVEQGLPIWIDTSSDLTDNDYFQHKGWVILTELVVDTASPKLAHVGIKYIKISDYENEWFTMDYSNGILDGISLPITYNPYAQVNMLYEATGADVTTNWSTIRKYPSTATVSLANTSNMWNLSCRSAVNAQWAFSWIYSDTYTFSGAWTYETILNRGTLPGAGAQPAQFGVAISPNVMPNGSANMTLRQPGDWMEFIWAVSNTSTSYNLRTMYGTKWINMLSNVNVGTVATRMGLKMTFTTDGRVRVYVDIGVTGTWTQVYYGPSGIVHYSRPQNLYMVNYNKSSTAYVGLLEEMLTYKFADISSLPNIMTVPTGATLGTAATGTRTFEDGATSYYTNPSSIYRFQTTAANLYKGSVKLFSTNNTGSVSTQIFSTNTKLTPTTTVLKNGQTRLTFTANGFTLAAYDSGQWNDVNTVVYPVAINLIKPIFISPERIVLQVNDTKITMLRSVRHVNIEHPNTVLSYTLMDRYFHDYALQSSPGAAADITMASVTLGYYAQVYNNASSTYQLSIGKTNPCTIKSDSIPADTMTGLGWFKSGDTGINAADKLIQEWYMQTRTGIDLKQIV